MLSLHIQTSYTISIKLTMLFRQLERLKIEHPDKQVIIVTFASDVIIYNYGQILSTATGCQLESYELLIEKGRGLAQDLPILPLSSAFE